MTTVVVDANVYISALVFGGVPQQVLDLIYNQILPGRQPCFGVAQAAQADFLVTGKTKPLSASPRSYEGNQSPPVSDPLDPLRRPAGGPAADQGVRPTNFFTKPP